DDGGACGVGGVWGAGWSRGGVAVMASGLRAGTIACGRETGAAGPLLAGGAANGGSGVSRPRPGYRGGCGRGAAGVDGPGGADTAASGLAPDCGSGGLPLR